MCSPVMLAFTAFTAMNQVNQGNAAKAQANAQAGQEDYQAKVANDDALATAGMIRRATERQRGQATAAYAGAGVKVGEGTAGEVDRSITQGGEQDAFMAILSGSRRARGLNQEADLTRLAGRNAQRAAQVNAIGTALSGGYNAARASGWASQGVGFSGTQSPAPVVNRDLRY